MQAGEVTRIRVNPRDCQGVLDVMELLPVPFKEEMSFAQCVSLTLSSLLETARHQGMIPEPDPFQFANRMEKYRAGRMRHGRKVHLSNTAGDLGSKFLAPKVSPKGRPLLQETDEQKTAIVRLRELGAKFAQSVEDGSGVVFTKEDKEEQERLLRLV